MTLDYTTVGKVKITILDYIDEIVDTFDKADPTGGSTKSRAAPDILFKVGKYCLKKSQTSCGVSSPGGKNIIFYQAGQSRHLNLNLIPQHKRDRISQLLLGQVDPSNEIYQRHKEPTTYPEL